jgi:hypothetical protein
MGCANSGRMGCSTRADLGPTRLTTPVRVGFLEEGTDGYPILGMSLDYRQFTGAITHDFLLRA